MKQKKEKYIIAPLMIGGGIEEDIEDFVKNKLNSLPFKGLITHIGNKDIISFNQVQGTELKDKVLNYIEIMEKMEKILKKMKKKGIVDGIVIDGQSYVQTAQGAPTLDGKHKFYAQYVENLRKELANLLTEYLKEEIEPLIINMNKNKSVIDKLTKDTDEYKSNLEKSKKERKDLEEKKEQLENEKTIIGDNIKNLESLKIYHTIV